MGDLGSALFLGSAAVASAVGFSSTHAAPEAMLGERCRLASDVYSLGILLVELTTLTPVVKRGGWRMPSAPHDCPQVRRPVTGALQTRLLAADWWLRLSLAAVPALTGSSGGCPSSPCPP